MLALRTLIQRLLVLLNASPLRPALHAVYALGVRRTVRALAAHPAVYSIDGTGSFFEGTSVYGLSDVDLIIVLDRGVARTDPAPHELALLYRRHRRLFPFIGNWGEMADNLLFLSDLEAGFELPPSYALRAKQGRLVRLYGPDLPAAVSPLTAGPDVRASEIVAEVNGLLRIALSKGAVHTGNLRFWAKLFAKLAGLAETLGLREVADGIRTDDALGFLDRSDRWLYARRSDPDRLLPRFIAAAQALFAAIEAREPAETVRVERTGGGMHDAGAPERAALVEAVRAVVPVRTWAVPSTLFGLTPRLNYFPPGEAIPVLELTRGDHRSVRALRRVLKEQGRWAGSLLVRLNGLLFIATHGDYVDLVPLDPLLHANVYAHLEAPHDAGLAFEMPASVLEDQRAVAHGMLRGLAARYRADAGWIDKLPFPCVYAEDDLVVMRDALHRMRVLLLHTDGLDVAEPEALLALLTERHPASAPLLEALLAYYRHLAWGEGPAPEANNVFRALLGFMDALLRGEDAIAAEPPLERLGITVGIITRNRAADLREALDSLTRQRRAADEVLVVDNGSTDDTRAVAEAFRDRLPLTYRFLPDASIPAARNLVLDTARHDVISFTDDDCVIEPGWLHAVERGFLRADNVGVVGGSVWHEPDPTPSMIDTYYSLYHHNKA